MGRHHQHQPSLLRPPQLRLDLWESGSEHAGLMSARCVLVLGLSLWFDRLGIGAARSPSACLALAAGWLATGVVPKGVKRS